MGMGGKSGARGGPSPTSAATETVSEVGNELATQGPDIISVIILVLFTGMFVAGLGLILVIIFFIISLVQQALNLFPPPLDMLFKSFKLF